MEKLSSKDWSEYLEIQVIDPDGWNRSDFNKSWSEKITKQEFLDRVRFSTIFLKTY